MAREPNLHRSMRSIQRIFEPEHAESHKRGRRGAPPAAAPLYRSQLLPGSHVVFVEAKLALFQSTPPACRASFANDETKMCYPQKTVEAYTSTTNSPLGTQGSRASNKIGVTEARKVSDQLQLICLSGCMEEDVKSQCGGSPRPGLP
jgi:hypothetical protein